ncbi:uncharacterized protein TNCV_3250121 [Trichonephila clavipes]|nr:uncharacterized protein TNCV_3250121 [Trichonephila clavipes]
MEKTADSHPTSCNFLEFNKMSKVKKILDEAREQNCPEIDLVDKGITSFEEMPALHARMNLALRLCFTPTTSSLVTDSGHKKIVFAKGPPTNSNLNSWVYYLITL